MRKFLAFLLVFTTTTAFAGTSTAPVDIGSTGSVSISGSIPAGSAVIGKTGIDQTTPGTTNRVSIGTDGTVAIGTALPAGSALLGKMGIDQTTPGTTNGVQVNAALPAGANVIGGVKIDQTTPGTTNGVQINAALPTGANTIGNVNAKMQDGAGTAITSTSSALDVNIKSGSLSTTAAFSTRSDTFTAAANGTTVNVSTAPLKSFSLAVKATGAVTSWTVVLECSLDNTNFTTVLTHTNTSPGDGQIMAAGTSLFPCMYFRSRLSAITLGGGTNVVATILGM